MIAEPVHQQDMRKVHQGHELLEGSRIKSLRIFFPLSPCKMILSSSIEGGKEEAKKVILIASLFSIHVTYFLAFQRINEVVIGTI